MSIAQSSAPKSGEVGQRRKWLAKETQGNQINQDQTAIAGDNSSVKFLENITGTSST